MNKKAKRRAFYICAAVFIMYVVVGLGLPEKMSARRLSQADEIKPATADIYSETVSKAISPSGRRVSPTGAPGSPPVEKKAEPLTAAVPVKGVSVAPSPPSSSDAEETEAIDAAPSVAPKPPVAVKERPRQTFSVFVRDGSEGEPSLFMAIPIVCHALKEGLIEKDGLIFIKKTGYNNLDWKKPLDILKDKDEEGLRSISKAIGKNQLHAFLKREGILEKQEISSDDIVLGKGYTVEKKKLLSLYDRYVDGEYMKLFPFSLEGVAVTRNKKGFEFMAQREVSREQRAREEPEWMMPNLINLTMRDAIEKLSSRTTKIRVLGSGFVTDQDPKPFQRARGETACVLYGRVNK